MIPLLNLIEPITGVVNKVMEHFWPPTMTEAEKQKAKTEAQVMVQQLAMAEDSQLRQFMLEYEGRAKDLPRSMQILRASVRPLLTYLLIGTTAWLVWNGQEIPTMLFQLDMLCAGFWFGERAVRNYIHAKQGKD